ncbi:MAG: hypothetical protein JO093_24235 [Acidobacteria bacterium]|nr:hypothetical protein [Acidobacteriota bacterium]MBV9188740.1 hypothetical protein [Acidobacteriota bacterium]
MSFVYHANALAFGGVLRNPCCEVIPSTGVVLSPSGGEGSETIRNYNYKGIITFDEASVYVAGSQRGRYRNTIATVSIRNLNVLNMVKVELLIARVTSEHLATDTGRQSSCEEPQFTFEGSLLENVRIGGRSVGVKLDHSLFSRYATHSALVKAFADKASADDQALGISPRAADGDDNLATRYGKRFCWPRESTGNGAPSRNDVIRCSLVDSSDIPEADPDEDLNNEETRRVADRIKPVRRNGYIIRIADFGTIAVGEVVLKPHQRTVNMLRFNLGSPHEGEMTFGSPTTNGTDMFPP